MTEKHKDSKTQNYGAATATSAIGRQLEIIKPNLRSLLAVLLGSFTFLSLLLENPLSKELLLSSIIIGCALILDEVSEKYHININIKEADQNREDYDQ